MNSRGHLPERALSPHIGAAATGEHGDEGYSRDLNKEAERAATVEHGAAGYARVRQ